MFDVVVFECYGIRDIDWKIGDDGKVFVGFDRF